MASKLKGCASKACCPLRSDSPIVSSSGFSGPAPSPATCIQHHDSQHNFMMKQQLLKLTSHDNLNSVALHSNPSHSPSRPQQQQPQNNGVTRRPSQPRNRTSTGGSRRIIRSVGARLGAPSKGSQPNHPAFSGEQYLCTVIPGSRPNIGKTQPSSWIKHFQCRIHSVIIGREVFQSTQSCESLQ